MQISPTRSFWHCNPYTANVLAGLQDDQPWPMTKNGCSTVASTNTSETYVEEVGANQRGGGVVFQGQKIIDKRQLLGRFLGFFLLFLAYFSPLVPIFCSLFPNFWGLPAPQFDVCLQIWTKLWHKVFGTRIRIQKSVSSLTKFTPFRCKPKTDFFKRLN